jgi:hypothetical protein
VRTWPIYMHACVVLAGSNSLHFTRTTIHASARGLQIYIHATADPAVGGGGVCVGGGGGASPPTTLRMKR